MLKFNENPDCPSEAYRANSDDSLANILIDNTKNDNDIKADLKRKLRDSRAIFITINPDPEKEPNRRYFKKLISKWRKYIKKIYSDTAELYYRFERSKVAKLHVHGVIYNIPETYIGYEGLFEKIQKYIHKDIGRKKVKHSVCCDMQWADSEDAVIEYIFKNRK